MKVRVLCLVVSTSVTLSCFTSQNSSKILLPVNQECPLLEPIHTIAALAQQCNMLAKKCSQLNGENSRLNKDNQELISQINEISYRLTSRKTEITKLKILLNKDNPHPEISRLRIKPPRHVQLEEKIKILTNRCDELSFSYVSASRELISTTTYNNILSKHNKKLKKSLTKARRRLNKRTRRKRSKARRKG